MHLITQGNGLEAHWFDNEQNSNHIFPSYPTFYSMDRDALSKNIA